MSQLNLPTLNLFNKTPKTSYRLYQKQPSRESSPLRDVLKETNRIDQHLYVPYLPYRPTIYDQEYLRARQAIKLEYLNTYSETLRKAEANLQVNSYLNSKRIENENLHGGLSFRKLESQPCSCEVERGVSVSVQKLKPIVKTPYVNHQYVPSATFNNAQNLKDKTTAPSRDVYLEGKKREKEEADISIIQRINNSLLKSELNNNNNNNNIGKILINDSNVMNTNQSLFLEVPPPQPQKQPSQQQQKKPLVSEQVQTDEMGNRSFIYNEHKRQKMDQANFQRTIRELNSQINSLNLQLSSQDVIIDLSDLVQTKEQYFEESKEILHSLQILSDENTSNRIMMRSKRHGEMVWPQF